MVYTNLKLDAKIQLETLSSEDKKYSKANDILDLRVGNVICGLGTINIPARELEGGECRGLFSHYYGGGLR